MATIQAKTISQLMETSSVTDKSLFYVSLPNGSDKMESRKISYENFQNQLSTNIDSAFAGKYGLKNEDTPLSLSELSGKVTTILTGTQTFSGTKTFNGDVKSNFTGKRENASFVRKQDVSDIVGQSAVFLRSNSQVQEYNHTENTDNKNNLRFNDNAYDASDNAYVTKPLSNTETGSLVTEKNGLLVIYGWLADNGNIYPHQAWVALEAYNTSSNKWIKVAVQNWNISSHSSSIQYVGFNIMVSSGVKFRIATGFPVNKTASALSQDTSLVGNEDEHCTFKAYQFY